MPGILSKLAVVVIVRVMILLIPQPEALQLMAILGILGVITGELVAWRARDFVRMLSFSSIGQLGLVFLAFSIPGETGMMAGIALMLHHLLVKPALFMLASGWSGSIAKMAGVARRSPWSVFLFVLLILSLLGIPPLPGFWAKYLLMLGLSAQDSFVYTLGMIAVPLAMIVEMAYLFRVVMIMYRKEDAGVDSGAIVKQHSKWGLAVATSVGVILIAIVLQLQPASNKLTALAQQLSDRNYYIMTVFPQFHSATHTTKGGMQSIK
jgi:formate hydrogenlyase subunit 3/multisubunit Na+/H+ antiporter MnhD subunit